MDLHTKRVIDYYDATHIDYRVLWSGTRERAVHFGYYDEHARSHLSALARMNAVLAKAAAITREDNVLDAGCGYGGSAMWLAENIGCEVTGVTLSPLQAAKSKRYISERALKSKVNILEGNYEDLPFDNETFTVYWALESLVHASNRLRALREASRVLKRDARLVIAEYTVGENLSEREKQYIRPWLEGWAMPELLSPSELIHHLTETGFANIKVENITEHVKPSLKRLEVLSMTNFPIALFIAPFFFRKERLENYYASWRQINALKKGLWEYSLITARKI
jgi:tocopherol O-methyltransferase